MKKILGLSVAALLVMALVGGGTWAYFSDPEVSTGNVLGAGTLDLNWAGGDDTGTKVLDLSAKAPGDSGNVTQPLHNEGSLSGELDIAFSVITNTGAVSGTLEYADDVGHLGASCNMSVFLDVDESDTWSTGDIGLKSDGTTYNHPTALDYDVIDNYASETFGAVIAAMAAGATDNFYILWDIDTAIGNAIQGDSVSFDINFTLEQSGVD